ncbi:MAG: adenosylcobinamide-phosphate synthase CbiB [Alicyclobacillus sp.]|nr:adenosylcobinamide-phosphate synthase CbiB [Alicyclobacillus sp.]
MNQLLAASIALLVDLVVGDPRWVPHPVVWMGRYIAWMDRRLNTAHAVPRTKRLRGVWLAASTLLMAAGAPWLALMVVRHYASWFGWVLDVLLVSTTIAWKGLAQAGWEVLRPLQAADLAAARRAVSMIVGRDTEHLSEAEVVRATVETLAENIVDAVVSPVFYACIGGAPLAFLYRAANTLDSMVGYRNDRYRDFGWCSARVDDVLNFIPARLTIGILCIALWVAKGRPIRALQVMWRDARRHPSPNSGIPEAMFAGGLGVQLGGLNFYGGVASHRATMGTPERPLEPRDIPRAIRTVHAACAVLLVAAAIGGVFVWRW